MELEEVAGKCRACQEETSEESQISIYSQENLKDIFHDVTSIKIDRKDKLPGVLCGKCHTRLLDAHQFRQMCAVSALKFHKILNNLVPKRTKNPLPLNKKKKKPARKVKKKQIKREFRTEEEQLVNSYSELHPTEYVELPEELTKVLSPKREQNDDDDDSNSFHGFDDDTSRENLEAGKTEEITIKPDPEEMPESIRDMQKSKPVADSDFSCYICKRVFLRKSGLTSHLTQVHKNTKASVCKICGKDCLQTTKMDVHMTEVHGITKGLSCKICGKTYKHRYSLGMHRRQMHGKNGPVKRSKNVMCEKCGKAFTCEAFLLRHSYTHSGLRPFICAHCPKTYADKSALRIHLLQHFGIKNYVCKICGLRMTTISKLNVHMNFHTKKRTHTCRFCNKVFTGLANMKRHVNLVHLGIKAYPCKECGRAFGKQETLRHHEMIHTGEKPEVCNVCGKRFIQRVALKKHMQTHERRK
ncbi:hypothetical protein DMENIID0001_064320 [Sergentomyia squamirostris]